jgi:hypothetical protein
MTIRLFYLFLSAVLLAGCSHRINISRVKKSSPGLETIGFEAKGVYPEPVIKYFVNKIKTPDKLKISSGIELYRISYYTRNEAGKKILVSGLLAIPRNKKIKGVVSYHHGTNSERSNAPSKPSQDEGLAISAVFAGGGYLCLVPDYIGLGVSTDIPTYLHVETTVNAVIDLIKIGSEICASLTGKQINNLFLAGVSQGGHTTAAVHRYLEKNPVSGLKLIASSSIAGAYDLRKISIPYAIEKNSVFYLGYIANSYCHIYGKPLSSIIAAPYDTAVTWIFDGNYSYDQIKSSLPKTAGELYTKEILSDLKTGKADWFTEKLEENQTYDWKPEAKFRMYYGLNDNDVSPKDAESAYSRMKQLGGNIQLIGLGNLNHIQTAYSGLPKTRAYFDSLTFLQQNPVKMPETK